MVRATSVVVVCASDMKKERGGTVRAKGRGGTERANGRVSKARGGFLMGGGGMSFGGGNNGGGKAAFPRARVVGDVRRADMKKDEEADVDEEREIE